MTLYNVGASPLGSRHGRMVNLPLLSSDCRGPLLWSKKVRPSRILNKEWIKDHPWWVTRLATDLMISCCWYRTRARSTLNFLAIRNLTADAHGNWKRSVSILNRSKIIGIIDNWEAVKWCAVHIHCWVIRRTYWTLNWASIWRRE